MFRAIYSRRRVLTRCDSNSASRPCTAGQVPGTAAARPSTQLLEKTGSCHPVIASYLVSLLYFPPSVWRPRCAACGSTNSLALGAIRIRNATTSVTHYKRLGCNANILNFAMLGRYTHLFATRAIEIRTRVQHQRRELLVHCERKLEKQ